jgi:hypothetical protein
MGDYVSRCLAVEEQFSATTALRWKHERHVFEGYITFQPLGVPAVYSL